LIEAGSNGGLASRNEASTMRLTIDPLAIDLDEWAVELPLFDDWLGPLWSIRPGVSSPISSRGAVHPGCQASAAWLRALWGYSI
jgi:hypothetical protein